MRLACSAAGTSSSGTFRFHPLLREFLEGQLARELSPTDLSAAHLRVARAAELEDWLAACRHYVAAGDQVDRCPPA